MASPGKVSFVPFPTIAQGTAGIVQRNAIIKLPRQIAVSHRILLLLLWSFGNPFVPANYILGGPHKNTHIFYYDWAKRAERGSQKQQGVGRWNGNRIENLKEFIHII